MDTPAWDSAACAVLDTHRSRRSWLHRTSRSSTKLPKARDERNAPSKLLEQTAAGVQRPRHPRRSQLSASMGGEVKGDMDTWSTPPGMRR